MEIRLANYNDCEAILNIFDEAKAYLKSQNIDQWQNGYPNLESTQLDIDLGHCYVLCDGDKVIATAAILFEDDPNYDYIENGAWLSMSPYGVIHRIACLPNYKGQGLASMFFEYAKLLGKTKHMNSLRVDTHEKNLSMQRLIAKNQFQYCGVVYMADGGKRFGYEYVFEKEKPYGF